MIYFLSTSEWNQHRGCRASSSIAEPPRSVKWSQKTGWPETDMDRSESGGRLNIYAVKRRSVKQSLACLFSVTFMQMFYDPNGEKQDRMLASSVPANNLRSDHSHVLPCTPRRLSISSSSVAPNCSLSTHTHNLLMCTWQTLSNIETPY